MPTSTMALPARRPGKLPVGWKNSVTGHDSREPLSPTGAGWTGVLKRNDPAIYPGTYATCVHTYAAAACGQHRDSRGEIRPDMSGCKPLTCRNVALTPGNIGNLRQEIVRIDDELQSRPLLPRCCKHRLGARRENITSFLARHTPDVNHEPRR